MIRLRSFVKARELVLSLYFLLFLRCEVFCGVVTPRKLSSSRISFIRPYPEFSNLGFSIFSKRCREQNLQYLHKSRFATTRSPPPAHVVFFNPSLPPSLPVTELAKRDRTQRRSSFTRRSDDLYCEPKFFCR